MGRAILNLIRLFENFRYYRNQGIEMHQAWHLAKLTLPEWLPRRNGGSHQL